MVANSQSQKNVIMIDAFSDYLGLGHPTEYIESMPRHPAMLIHWRVLVCILQFGFSEQGRDEVVRFPQPHAQDREDLTLP